MDGSKRKKVLLICNLLAPYREPLFKNLLKKNEYQFKIFFFDKRGDKRWKIEENISFEKSFFQILIKFNPELLICGGYNFYSFLALIYKVVFRKKMVLWSAETVESEKYRKSFNNLRKIFRTPMFKAVDGWMTYGQPARQYLLNHGVSDARINIINNPSDMSWEIIKKRGCPPKVILSIIRMVEQKNPFSIIELAKRAANKYPELTFIVIGDGPLVAEFKKLISENNLKNVKHFEKVDRSNIGKYYLRSSLLLHIPKYDQWPQVINEAMIYGLPVICTEKCGIPDDLVEDEVNGFIIKENDYDSFIEKIYYLTQNVKDNKKFGNLSQLKIKNINIENTAKLIIETLDKVHH